MDARRVLIASSVALGAAGLTAIFLPQEALARMGVHASVQGVTLVQLLGAALLGFAFLNWSAKGSRVGGIYNRPLVLANLVHFVTGALTLARLVPGRWSIPLVAVTIVYGLLATAFAGLLFGDPIGREAGASANAARS